MELVRGWLAVLGAPELADELAGLPGRDPFANGPGPTPPIGWAEWSLREGSEAVRFAWNVDPGRASAARVLGVLRRWGSVPEAVATLEAALAGVHLQVGRDGARTKLYVYARGAPPETLARVAEAVGAAPLPGAAFVALDLPDLALKHYVDLARTAAAARLGERGATALAAWCTSLPDGLGSAPGAFVVSERSRGAVAVDVSLHARVDRAPERLAELAGPELAARAAERFRQASRMGLRLVPTHVSRLERSGAPIRTVYYRLEPRR